MRLSGPPAIILGLSETGLAVARSLFARRIKVIGIDSKLSPAALSRCFAETRILSDLNHRALLVMLAQIKKGTSELPVLFPTNDYYVHFTFSHFKRLQGLVRLPANSRKILETILDKWLFYLFCQQHDLPVPGTVKLASYQDLLLAAKKFNYPFIVKPRYPYLGRTPYIDKTRIIHSPQELHYLEGVHYSENEFIAQEMIAGEDDLLHYSFASMVSRVGEIYGCLSAQKVRQSPPNQGVGTCVRSVDNEQVTALGKSLLWLLDYKGVSEIEFKQDPQSGEYKIIEMNARFWSQTALAVACGLNFPVQYYFDQIKFPASVCTTSPPSGVYWINFLDDFYALFNRHNGYFWYSRFSWAKYLLYLLKVRAWGYWSLSDPRPFFKQLMEIFIKKN